MVLYDGLKEDCGVTMVFCIHPDRRFAHAARATPGPPGLSSSALRLTACAMERRRRATISVQCEVEGLELKLELSEGEAEGAEPWSGAQKRASEAFRCRSLWARLCATSGGNRLWLGTCRSRACHQRRGGLFSIDLR